MFTKGAIIFSEPSGYFLFLCAPFLVGYLLILCAEWRRHRLNARFLLFAGATPVAHRLTRAYYLLIIGFLPFALIESWYRWTGTVALWQLAGLAMMVGGTGLRVWALSTLGAAWTMGCLRWPQMPRIRRGPYRWMRHPEYVSRLMDCTGLCLVFNAFLTAGVLVPVMVLLSLKIIRIEAPNVELMREEDVAEPLGDAGFVS